MTVQGKGIAGYPLPAPVPVKGITVLAPEKSRKGAEVQGKSFGDIFQAELSRPQELKFSAHAERRLKERNIELSGEDRSRIENAVQRAANKGSRESLVIYGDIALVANIKNRTVITAMDGESLKEHIFTNIDSAVIVK